ncbi:BTAD domain-containing putative transcriptional regulator [Actinosynnema sp. NPDC020468]|uniref:BTAD domain-containing putative transcriptional regulator n=1 Tax=Actinosynnema sp. NPDC020468 TaxID=3154488 RepID=UPI003403F4D0
MRVAVLGPLLVTDVDGAAVEVRGRRLRVLLSRLAQDAGHVVPFDRLVDALWPDDPPVDAGAALHSLVSRLRRAIGAGTVASHPTGYLLTAEVDAAEFAGLCARHEYAAALALWRGPAFQDTPGVAARWEDLRLTAVEASVTDLAELRRLCAEHPAREGLHARLVRTLYARGRRADALAAYDRVRAHLADELGVDPGPALREAHLVALREDPPAEPRPARVPVPATDLVGRVADLARVADLLAGSRLVTVAGFGGVGKTRLAQAVAAAGADPVVWVGLESTVDDPAAAVLLALGPHDPGATALGERAAGDPVESLRGARCLLVLDNCEQVVDQVAALVARLLPVAPHVRVLATSREPLGVPGESLHRLEPLDPDGAAVELFAARARAVRPDFAVDDDVRLVCRALDGIPLALELAAARLRAMTTAQLAELVGERLRLLDRGARSGAARHRTLRAVLDWSWGLLSGAERRLLAVLAVFAGGATADAVAAVAGVDRWEALDLLSSLVDKSLVVNRSARYVLLETVREYASGKPAPGAVDAHATYFLELAETAEPGLRGPDQLTWIAVFDAEHANLDAALARFAAIGDGARALRLLIARTWWWLVIRGRIEDARAWARVVDPVASDPLSRLLARGEVTDGLWDTAHPAVLLALAGAVWGSATVARSADRLAAADDPWLRAAGEVLHGLVAFEMSTGRAADAERHYRAALAGFARVGDRWALVFCHACLSTVLENRGAAAEALDHLNAARDHAEGLGGLEDVLVPLTLVVRVGRLRARTGDFAGAAAALARAREIADRRADPMERARVALAWAELAARSGDPTTATTRFHEALTLAPPDAAAQFLATVHSGLAAVSTGPEAEAGHRRAVALAESTPDGPARAMVWEAYATHHRATGDRAAAREALTKATEARGVLALADPGVAATAAWAAAPGDEVPGQDALSADRGTPV